tara:strand:- start:481 stop:1233 length:753 start_codon:yes stop_codon:yes gene_type:complete
MANTIQLKRKSTTNMSGVTLARGEVLHNESDDILWIGEGSSVSNIEIGGRGYFTTLGTTQTVTGAKTMNSASNVFTGNGAALTSLNGSNISSGTVAAARLPDLDDITAPSGNVSINSNKIVNLADPVDNTDAANKQYVASQITDASIGAATASTPSSNDNSTRVATTAYVQTELGELINSAPVALDTLKELAEALGDDANFSTTINTALGNRLRIDVDNQGLSATEKTNAQTNMFGVAFADTTIDGGTLS